MKKIIILCIVIAGFLAVKPLKIEPAVSPLQISGMVVPHHDLVKAQRTEVFKKVGERIAEPKTVVLVSPNHYSAGRANIQTTDQTWHIDSGTIEPDSTVISSIIDHGSSLEPGSFTNEHGIYLMLDDIKRTFPDARIVPIILKINTPASSVQALHDALKKSCDRCLLIASVDFSHYQPAVLASEHDELSIRALDNLDEEVIRRDAEVDSPPALQLLIEWAKSHGTEHFELTNHTNSGELLHDSDSETTTHVFGYYTDGPKVQPERRVSFLIGGDMMFGRMINHTFQNNLQESVTNLGDRLFWGTDAGIVNLEGAVSAMPVVDDPSPTFKFVFSPQAVNVLTYLHINAASLANNHSNNAGPGGEDVTRQLLAKAGIQAIGGWSGTDAVRTATFQGEGLKLTIVGVHTLLEQPDLTQLIKQVKQDPDQRVIIFPHWGIEYQSIHSAQQQQLAHTWIDAGADAVIGSHPHVIEDAEVYQGKPVIYSLGNLLFDQNWSVPTQEGMLVGGAFTDNGLELFGLPTISKIFKPELARGALRQQLLKKIEGGMINR